MDAIVFGVKRAHWVLHHRLVGKLLKPCALTPSRFDAMYLLFERRTNFLTQAELRRKLGIARGTISRTLRELERLDFVSRSSARNGATRRVRLTELGRYLLRNAMRRIFRPRLVRRVLDHIMKFHERETLERLLRNIRNALADSSADFYPWHPDDCM